MEKYDVLEKIADNGVFLLNSIYGPDEIWAHLPKITQERIINKKVKFYVIDGYEVAKQTGMGMRINTIMQTCFFAISGVLPKDEAIAKIKDSIKKAYGKKGEEVVKMNFNAVDQTLAHLHPVKVPAAVTSTAGLVPPVSKAAPDFVQRVTAEIIAGRGDDLPVSAMPIDGTFPLATTQWEKRNIALEVPVWDPATCIQCGKCVAVCPHAVIRSKVYDPAHLDKAPATFKSTDAKDREAAGKKFTLQISVGDCTGCGACVQTCPAKNKQENKLKAINMQPQLPLRQPEEANWEFFLTLPDPDRATIKKTVRGIQTMRPLFEFSGACAGCGETAYVKLLSQLYGDRAVIANATGCSSIYGGNLPTTPWAVNADGRGPAWSNSLFEDNAEFGLGFRLTIDKHTEYAGELLKRLESQLGADLVAALLSADQSEEAGIVEQRQRVAVLEG